MCEACWCAACAAGGTGGILPSRGSTEQSPSAKMSGSRVVCSVGRITSWLMRLVSSPSRSLRISAPLIPAAQTAMSAGKDLPLLVFTSVAVTSTACSEPITCTPSPCRVSVTALAMRSGSIGRMRGPASMSVTWRNRSGSMFSRPYSANMRRMFAEYGLENIDPERFLHVTLIDAGPRILPMLPERIAKAVTETLEGLGVRVVGSEQAVEVAASEVKTKSGKSFPADIAVWAAGIKGADILNDIDGLETNRLNQLVILPTLQTTRDPDIFALGDCSVLPREGRMPPVPPAAQAAHQQASHMVDTIERRLRGEPPRPFRYRDFGSLVSLGRYSTIGSLMGFLSGKSYRVEGWFARLMYLSLYRMHLYAL